VACGAAAQTAAHLVCQVNRNNSVNDDIEVGVLQGPELLFCNCIVQRQTGCS